VRVPIALLLSCSALAQAPAFEPGLRWQWSAGAAKPWIPRNLALDAESEVVLAAVAFQNPGLHLLSAAPFSGPFTWGADTNMASATSQLDAALSPDGLRGWSLAQYPFPDAAHRRTELAGYDFLAAAGVLPGGDFAPIWRTPLSLPTGGLALLAAEGAPTRLAVAVLETGASPRVVLHWIDAASGQIQLVQTHAASSLRALAASADGERVLLVTGSDLRVISATGALLHHVPLSAATDAAALSGDGRVLAYGVTGGLRIEREQDGQWSTWQTLAAASGELAARAALSADGATAALGWWHATSGNALRFEDWDLLGPTRLHEVVQVGTSGGLQNFPAVAACTSDGRHVAFGAWGQAGAEPELWVYEREGAAPLFSVSLPGSVQALALSEDGARVAVAYKGAHANQFATTGGVRLYDTGARDLVVVEPAALGGKLSVQARRAGASACVFVLGSPGPQVAILGIAGLLGIDPQLPWFAQFSACGPQGLASWSFDLPQEPSLAGHPAALQAVFALPTGPAFGASRALPLLL